MIVHVPEQFKYFGLALLILLSVAAIVLSSTSPDVTGLSVLEDAGSLHGGFAELVASPVKKLAKLLSSGSGQNADKPSGILGFPVQKNSGRGGGGSGGVGSGGASGFAETISPPAAGNVPAMVSPAVPSPTRVQSSVGIVKEYVPPEREEPYFLKRKIDAAKKCLGCMQGLVDVSEAVLSQAAQKTNALRPAAEKDSKPAEWKVGKGLSKTSGKKTSVLVQVSAQADLQETAAIVKSLGGEVEFAGSVGNIISVIVPESSVYEIAKLDNVVSVSRDEEFSALLMDSIPQIDANFAFGENYSGYGVRVAVVDTGIEKSNPMLLGKVVSEADFSSAGTSAIPGEIIDSGLATIKVVLKEAVAPLGESVLKPALTTLQQSPDLLGSMAVFVAKHGDDSADSTKTWIRNSSLEKETIQTVDKMLADFGELTLNQTESLARAVKGLGADSWTQVEKKGLHKLVSEAEDAQGDAIVVSMKQSSEWSDNAVKQSIELNLDGTLKNFKTKGFDLGGKIPDAKASVNGKDYYIESSALENKLSSGNIQNLQNKLDEKYVQFGTTAAESTDNTIVIVLEKGSDLKANELQSELELLMNTLDAYKNLKRAIVFDNTTGDVIAKVI